MVIFKEKMLHGLDAAAVTVLYCTLSGCPDFGVL
jgi:hypothetical protein